MSLEVISCILKFGAMVKLYKGTRKNQNINKYIVSYCKINLISLSTVQQKMYVSLSKKIR